MKSNYGNNRSNNETKDIFGTANGTKRRYEAPACEAHCVAVEDGYALSGAGVEIGSSVPSGCGTEIVSEMAGPSRDFLYF